MNGEKSPSAPRREATVREAKARAHPLRLRILRLCWKQELTNRQIADRLGRDPGTVHYHVRQLVEAGLLEPAPVRSGDSGALEKPYRAKPRTWWLDDPPNADVDVAFAPIEAFQEELREAGPDSVRTFARFAVHLSPEDALELDRRILAILDDYLLTDHERLDQPAYGGFVILHQLAD